MRRKYRTKKRRSCTICKPHKRGAEPQERRRVEAKRFDAQQDVREVERGKARVHL